MIITHQNPSGKTMLGSEWVLTVIKKCELEKILLVTDIRFLNHKSLLLMQKKKNWDQMA